MEKYLLEMKQFIEDNTPMQMNSETRTKIRAYKCVNDWLKIAAEENNYKMFKYAIERAEYDLEAYNMVGIIDSYDCNIIAEIIWNMENAF